MKYGKDKQMQIKNDPNYEVLEDEQLRYRVTQTMKFGKMGRYRCK